MKKATKGVKRSEEAKRNISKAQKGLKRSEENKKNLSKAMTGVKRGPYKNRKNKGLL